MATFSGSPVSLVPRGFSITEAGAAAAAYERAAPDGVNLEDDFADIGDDSMVDQLESPGKTDFVRGRTFLANYDDRWSNYPEWWENYHVVPRRFEFGNILSVQTSPITVFSGYRREFGTWSSFVNNAGAGTSLLNQPALPAVMNPLEGYAMTLEVTTNGNPSVDDELAFVFDFGGSTISVPITLNRIVLFPVRPEIPYVERLRFRTNVIQAASGAEQRIKLRKNPRQFFEWDVRVDDGEFEKSRLDALLYDWQSRVWGVPMWHEATQLTASAPSGALTLNVQTTAFADYRVGGLVMVFTDAKSFDVQTIASFDGTSITLENALVNTFDSGAAVAPLRTGHMQQEVAETRWRSADTNLRVQFRVLDNDAQLGDTSEFGSYDGKVLLDECNVVVSSTINGTFNRNLVVVDNVTGQVYQDGVWGRGKHGFPLTLRANSKEQVWNLRRLMHALGGRQVSFYVPTYNKDLLPTLDLQAGSQDLVVENVGYSQFVRARQGRDVVWVRLIDGTVLIRQVTDAQNTSAATETLELASAWPSNISTTQIDRISYLELVRFDTDDITIRHERGDRLVRVSAPVIAAFES